MTLLFLAAMGGISGPPPAIIASLGRVRDVSPGITVKDVTPGIRAKDVSPGISARDMTPGIGVKDISQF